MKALDIHEAFQNFLKVNVSTKNSDNCMLET